MVKLYKFYWDCGRGGEVSGVFAADTTIIAEAIGKSVYFGEVLGKHSEVFGELDECDLEVLTEDQDFIARFKEIVGNIGHNPLNYIRDEEED